MTTRVTFCRAEVLGDNPGQFDAPISLRVVLEVFEKPPEGVIDVRFTWSPIWDDPVDQLLDEMEVGPLTHTGKHELVLESDPPAVKEIPDPTGPTALLVTFSYRGAEFLHLGFNVIVQFDGELPEVFTSCEGLTRSITGCFPKQTAIAWDSRADRRNNSMEMDTEDVKDRASEETEEGDSHSAPPTQRMKMEIK